MNENIKIGVGFLIPAAAIVAFFSSILSEQFLAGILIAVFGVFAWFLYSAVMETNMPNVTGNIIIVFGVLLSVATFLNYGLEQNMFGGFSINLEGVSGAAVLLFFSVLLGMLFRNKPLSPAIEHVATKPEISTATKTINEPDEEPGIDDDEFEYPSYEDYEDFYNEYYGDETSYEYDDD